VLVQGDMDSRTPTSAKIRFVVNFTTIPNLSTTDGYYILYNVNNSPSDIGTHLIKLKAANSSWVQNQDGLKVGDKTLTLPKTYSDEDYTIQDLWICNTGKGTVDQTNKTVTYASGTKTFNTWFAAGGARERYVAKFGSDQTTFKGPVATNVGKGTVSITDNGNNTFKISGTKGANGTNNTAEGFSLKWSYDSAKYDTATTNGANITLAGTTSTRTVYAKCITDATYGPDSEVVTSKIIKRYSAPHNPGKPALTSGSFKNGRLTVKQNWTYSWTKASAVTANSPIKGYRIRIYKNGDQPADRILGLTASGKTITQGTGTADYVDVPTTTSDATADNFSITFNPTNLGFKPGDTVQISIFAWTTNGAGAILWSGGGKSENQVMSDSTPVQNSGVIRVKVKGEWKEGQVYVKTAGKWKEAETVLVKTPKGWKESE
jgi:hypothetical protein